MNVIAHDCYTEIFLTEAEMKAQCRPGEGADTCIWLVFSGAGAECTYLNKLWSLVDRWRKGLTVAKRDGCDEVRSL